MKIRMLIALVFCTVATHGAAAGLIEVRLAGTSMLGLPGASPAPFSAAIRFDTGVDIENSVAESGRARFESVYVTALPSYVPPEQNMVLAEHNPQLARTLHLQASALPSHPSDRGLYLLPAYDASRVTVVLRDGTDADQLGIQISGGHSVHNQFSFSFTVTADGDSFWAGGGTNFSSLEDLESLVGAGLFNVSGSGRANEGRASPLNAWTLSIDEVSIVAVSDADTNGIVFLLCGMLLPILPRLIREPWHRVRG